MIFRPLEVGVKKKKEKRKERKKNGWILEIRTPLLVCDILPPYLHINSRRNMDIA